MVKFDFEVAITSNGQRIGSMSASKFQDYAGVHSAWLDTVVARFNAAKEAAGEPERAHTEMVINGKRRQIKL